MAWRPHGRAQVSSRNPRAFAICDLCGFLYNHDRLKWLMDWSGAGMENKRRLVCDRCLDEPQQQLRMRIIPPDPVPIRNPRPDTAASTASVQAGQFNFTLPGQSGMVAAF